eukprot:6183134-Amphidinium_carterae.1
MRTSQERVAYCNSVLKKQMTTSVRIALRFSQTLGANASKLNFCQLVTLPWTIVVFWTIKKCSNNYPLSQLRPIKHTPWFHGSPLL